jgi:hypothetical protein
MTQDAIGFSGVGLVNLHRRTSSGGKGIGRFVGNTNKLDLAFDPKSVERASSMNVARAPLRRMTQSTGATLTLVTDESSKANWAWATHGRVDTVASDVGTLNEVLPTDLVAGDIVSVANKNINTLVVTDSTGAPVTLVVGVNYTVDLFSGDITIVDLDVEGDPVVQPLKAAYKKGAVDVIAGLSVPDKDYWITLNGVNADTGEAGVLDIFRVRFDPAKLLSFISTDYLDFELGGTALIDTTKQADDIGGQIFRFTVASTTI